ncbi:MAG TPA: ROK family protein [Caulobacteraceae bacterium]|jgi:fructokinase
MIRIGVDFGGTKIEAAALDSQGRFVARVREPNPGEYGAAIDTVVRLVAEAEREAGVAGATVGVGMPGSISPQTGRVRNSNSVWLNGTTFDRDLAAALRRAIRVQNDANCFALSEATDGAAAGARVVFGAILGTGCGGGVVVGGELVEGANRIGGEWGHTPLPWLSELERATHVCWCGRTDCLETWISGTAFRADYLKATGRQLDGQAIVAAADAGDEEAQAALGRYVERLGRAFAVVCDIIDPDVIVCGGGMSNVPAIYADTPPELARRLFSDSFATRVTPAMHGDSSGVRGAAWLWPLNQP